MHQCVCVYGPALFSTRPPTHGSRTDARGHGRGNVPRDSTPEPHVARKHLPYTRWARCRPQIMHVGVIPIRRTWVVSRVAPRDTHATPKRVEHKITLYITATFITIQYGHENYDNSRSRRPWLSLGRCQSETASSRPHPLDGREGTQGILGHELTRRLAAEEDQVSAIDVVHWGRACTTSNARMRRWTV